MVLLVRCIKCACRLTKSMMYATPLVIDYIDKRRVRPGCRVQKDYTVGRRGDERQKNKSVIPALAVNKFD